MKFVRPAYFPFNGLNALAATYAPTFRPMARPTSVACLKWNPTYTRESAFSRAASATVAKVRVTPGSEPLVVEIGLVRPGTTASIIAAAAPPPVECALG